MLERLYKKVRAQNIAAFFCCLNRDYLQVRGKIHLIGLYENIRIPAIIAMVAENKLRACTI
jgi:hypothetical protein